MDNFIGEVVTIDTGYKPRPLQAKLHAEITRFSVFAMHRRFGKTVFCINELIDRGLTCQLPNAQVDYIAPYYRQAKSIAWQMLKDYTYMIPDAKAFESELKVVIPKGPRDKCTIQLFGADNPDSLKGRYSDHTVFDEFALQPPAIWTETVRPMLADRKGGATFIGTPHGKDNFYKLYNHALETEGWYAATYSAEDTGIIDDAELADMRESMPDDKFRQEMLCDWTAAVTGSYYRTELIRLEDEGRLCRVPYEPRLPVHLAFDLGVDDYTAVWFVQVIHKEIRLIRYMEFSDTGLFDVMKEIDKLPYKLGTLFMPWDVRVREMTTAVTREDALVDMGYTVEVATKISVADGINASREILSRVWIDKTNCLRGLDCLEHYRKKVDQKSGLMLDKPEHDEFSHGADAFRTFAVCYEGMLPYGGDGGSNGHNVLRSI